MRLIALAVLASMAGIAAPSAFADYYSAAAGLQCQGNLIAVRFGGASNDEPPTFYDLPSAYAAGWSRTPFADGNRCKLANGSEVVLRWGEYQSYAWGMGGGDPPAFFSLWIDGRKVFAKEQFKSGYGSSRAYLSSVFVSATVKEICRLPELGDPRAGDDKPPMTCASAPLRLEELVADPEVPTIEDAARIGTMTIAATHSEQFCRRFIESVEAPNPSLPRERIIFPSDARLFFPRDENGSDLPVGSDQRMAFVKAHTASGYFDLWNSGTPVTVVRFFGDEKLFYGDVLFYRQGAVSEEDIWSVRQERTSPGGRTTYYKDLAAKHRWGTITENPDVYESWSAFSMRDVTYLMQHRSFGSKWTLYRPNSEATLDTVCVFQLVEDHF